MREAAIPDYRLSKGKRSTRVLITLALFGLFLGLISSVAVTISKTGLKAESVKRYYLGNISNGTSLDTMLSPSQGRPLGELIEVTHLHILGGSILLFLLCHLLSLSSVSETTRTTLYSISFASFITTFSLPWLIVFISPGFAYLFGPAASILLISLFALCIIPIKEMWFNRL